MEPHRRNYMHKTSACAWMGMVDEWLLHGAKKTAAALIHLTRTPHARQQAAQQAGSPTTTHTHVSYVPF